MSEKDRQLVEQARKIHFCEWGLISDLIAQAESEEAKKIMSDIQIRDNHLEEASCGCL